jgi:hypothetical protein
MLIRDTEGPWINPYDFQIGNGGGGGVRLQILASGGLVHPLFCRSLVVNRGIRDE